MLSIWTNWIDERPIRAGLYWWRVGQRQYGDIKANIEFTAEVTSVGMGYSENELWPRFSHWNGYSRTVPEGTQWRESNAKKERKFTIPGVEFLCCPFCGRQPTLDGRNKSRDGGVLVCGYPYQYNSFDLECCIVRASGELDRVIQLWNTRLE